MLRLMHSFDLKVCDGNRTEISLQELLESDYNVGKRTVEGIFSNEWITKGQKERVRRQFQQIMENGVCVIHMERKFSDVSKGGRVSMMRYIHCKEQFDQYARYIPKIVKVSYENLLTRPDEIQQVIADRFGLIIKHKFSEYPSFVPTPNVHNEGNYSLRPIGEAWQ